MQIYDFTLVLSPETELTEELGNALFEVGCDDGSPGACEGIVSIDFHRETESLEKAIRSAIADVQKAGCTVARVEIDADAPAIQNA
ncbi:MAG: hypothetical protein ACOCWL_01845 [Thermoguttaceae bacterium]